MRVLIIFTFLIIATGCATLDPSAGPGRPFNFQQDTFAYANELVFNYEDGAHVAETNSSARERSYTRRCFIMAAGVVQFWKHARFEPGASPVSDEVLAKRIREVRDTAAWWPSEPPAKRIVFPGYKDLHELSATKGALLRANMGAGWTTYFHFRKFPMPFLPSLPAEADLCEEMRSWLRQGHPMVVWLYNFPDVNMNHCVTVYEEADKADPGKHVFHVYDPNYADGPRTLTFDAATSAFSYTNTFYFPGGTVHVRRMYTSLVR